MHRNRNLCSSFLMVKMASGMDHRHGRLRLAMTNDDEDVAQHGDHQANTKSWYGLQHISLILDMHITFNWQLSNQEIRRPVSRDHIVGSCLDLIKVTCIFWSGPLTKCWILFGSRAHVRLTCGKQGRIVQKPGNANPSFKVNQNVNFSPIQTFFAALFCVYGDH